MKIRNLALFSFGLITITISVFSIELALAKSLNKSIIGKWHIIGTAASMEFFEDGTIIYKESDTEFVGDYKHLDDTRLRLDFGGMGALMGPQVPRISRYNEDIILDTFLDEKIRLRKIDRVGEIYLAGIIALKNKDYKKAVDLIEKAAENGNVEAQNKIAFIYYYGLNGIEKNHQKAFKWASKAAKQNFAESQKLLGTLYYFGNGIEKDIGKSIIWLQKAVDNIDDINNSIYDAQNSLAWIYATSKNPKYRDGEKAVKYAKMAYAQQPNKWYINSTLAAAYARNNQFDKAVETYKKAIDLLKWDKVLSKDEKQRKLEVAKILLELYQNEQAYDEGYDIDAAISKKKEEHRNAQEAKKLATEEATKKKQLEYEKNKAEQKKIMEEESEKRKTEELRLGALKNKYMTPSKILYNFEFSVPFRQGSESYNKIEGEIKDTEIFWRERLITNKEVGRINRMQLPDSNWKEKTIWYGNIQTIEISNNSASYSSSRGIIWYLRINGVSSIICQEKNQVEGLYNELVAALSIWYDEFLDVAPQKTRPAFISKESKVSEQIKPEVDKTIVSNIQKKLSAIGFYSGRIDGIYGQGTASAITKYQRDNQLIADGIPTKSLLDHLNKKDVTHKTTAEKRIPDKPKNIEDAVTKAVDGIFKSIFKTD